MKNELTDQTMLCLCEPNIISGKQNPGSWLLGYCVVEVKESVTSLKCFSENLVPDLKQVVAVGWFLVEKTGYCDYYCMRMATPKSLSHYSLPLMLAIALQHNKWGVC